MNLDRFDAPAKILALLDEIEKHLDAPAKILALLEEVESELLDFVNHLESEDHPSLSAAQRNSIN